MKKLSYLFQEPVDPEITLDSPVLTPVSQECSNEELDDLLAHLRLIAYNSEVNVEDIPDPEPAPGQEDVWAELDAAYQEGVNAAYDQ